MRPWAALLLVACSSSTGSLEPHIDLPAADSAAYPYGAIDTLELSIARAGDEDAIALVTAGIADELVLGDIPYGEDLVVHLSGRAGGTEDAYGRTCPVNVAPGAETLAPHLFFSRVVRWGGGPELSVPQGLGVEGVSVGSSALALFVGGEAGEQVGVVDASSAEGGSVTSILRGTLTPRQGGTLTSFGAGALLVGGVDGASDVVLRSEMLLPLEENADTQVVSLDAPGITQHASIALQDGSVLVTGGLAQALPGDAFELAQAAQLYSLLGGEIVLRQLDGLAIPRTGHSMTRLGNEVGADILIIGGIDSAGFALADSELFRPLRAAFEPLSSARLIVPRYDHEAVRLPGGLVLVIGGLAPDPLGGAPTPVRELELYDPVQGVFALAGTLSSGAGVTGMSVTQLPDGRFLLTGGRDLDGIPVATVMIARFDPIDGVVDLSSTDSLARARADHAAVLLCDGTVLVAGGTTQASGETERYSPPSAGRR